MAKNIGIVALLETAVTILLKYAEEIQAAHTINGRWEQPDEHGAKRDFDKIQVTVKGLRKAIKYFTPNPLGGPAKLFDAIADMIRSGAKTKEAMRAYGVKFRKGKS